MQSCRPLYLCTGFMGRKIICTLITLSATTNSLSQFARKRTNFLNPCDNEAGSNQQKSTTAAKSKHIVLRPRSLSCRKNEDETRKSARGRLARYMSTFRQEFFVSFLR